MKTKTLSKVTRGTLVASALLLFNNMSAQQNTLAENIAPTHSIIFIASVLFFIVGFALLIVLKLRDDAKEKKESQTISHFGKHRHHHPNHYGHRHQYH